VEEGHSSLHVTAAGQTHLGRRPLNEDAWSIAHGADSAHLWAERGKLYAVADGMGGHAAGEAASQLAIETLWREYYAGDDLPLPPTLRVQQAILAANQEVYEQSALQESQAGMGTTIVAAVVREDWLTIANVGDSRAYLVRGGEAQQLTRDHSWVAEQVASGTLSQEEADNHAYRHVVTRCLGHRPNVQVDLFEHVLEPGDAILLCSDGLNNQVSDADIAHILSEHPPAEAANRLVALAYESGGADNITAIVLQVSESTGSLAHLEPIPATSAASPEAYVPSSGPPARRPRHRQRTVVLALISAFIVVFCVGAVLQVASQRDALKSWLQPLLGPLLAPLITAPTPGPTPAPTLAPAAVLTATRAPPTPTTVPTATQMPSATPTPTATATQAPRPTSTATQMPPSPTQTPLPTSGPRLVP
jgi:serine/threonine protein phosphatase PrpC